jgi:hypothetical protein
MRGRVSKYVTNGSKTAVMDVISFLCVSLGSSTVRFVTVYVSHAHAHLQRTVSAIKIATLLEEYTTEEQRSLVIFFCGQKNSMQRIFIGLKVFFSVYGGNCSFYCSGFQSACHNILLAFICRITPLPTALKSDCLLVLSVISITTSRRSEPTNKSRRKLTPCMICGIFLALICSIYAILLPGLSTGHFQRYFPTYVLYAFFLVPPDMVSSLQQSTGLHQLAICIVTCMSDSRRGFGLEIEFTDHLYTPLGNTSTYSAISTIHKSPQHPLRLFQPFPGNCY